MNIKLKVSFKPSGRLAESRDRVPCGRFGEVRVSGEDLCAAEEMTEPTGETALQLFIASVMISQETIKMPSPFR